MVISLEQRLNSFNIHKHGLEVEPLISECFELGFFPWDNPKFLVFLERTIENNLTTHRPWGKGSRVRGGVYARTAIALIDADSPANYLRDRLIDLLKREAQVSDSEAEAPVPDVLYWVEQAAKRQNILLTAGFNAVAAIE